VLVVRHFNSLPKSTQISPANSDPMRGDQEYSSNSVWILRNISQIQDISNIRTVELSSQRSSFDVLISMFFFKDGIPPRPEGWPGRLLPHEPKKGHFPPEATALPEHAGLKTCCPKLPAQIRLDPFHPLRRKETHLTTWQSRKNPSGRSKYGTW